MRLPLYTLAVISTGMAIGCMGDTHQPEGNGTTLLYEHADYEHAVGQTRGLARVAGSGTAATGQERAVIGAARVEPASVLIWYSHDYGQLRSTLEDLGHHVTTSTTLPDDLTTYDVIWHVGAFRPIGGSEHARLLAFLAADGGLHMTGERPCCEPLNQSWTQLIGAAVRGDSITIGRQGDVFAITGSYAYPYPVSRDAKEGVATMPREVQNLQLIAAGGIAGLANAANVLAYGRAADGTHMPVGALWSSDDLVGGSGRLSILMDANWFSLLGSADNAAMVANLQIFLQGSATNHCPVALAGQDRQIACLAPGELAAVTLDGTEASDDDGDALTYEWYDDGGRMIASGPTPTVELPAGEHDIALVVGDGICASVPDTVHISLQADDEPPRLEVVPKIELWPPNHAYHTFTLSECVASIRDSCDAALDVDSAGRILWVSSNQPDDARGDGHTSGDIIVLDDRTFQVRAERQGNGKGRVYQVGFAVTDASGNTATAICQLGVPHDR